MRTCNLWATSVCFALATLPLLSQSPLPMVYKAAATTKFGNHPALPACATIAVQDGDPGAGPSIILIKFKPGCSIPWHWHTPNERLVIVSGSAKGEMKDIFQVTPSVKALLEKPFEPKKLRELVLGALPPKK